MGSALVDEDFCLNIPLGILNGQHKHHLHNEELERQYATLPQPPEHEAYNRMQI